MAVHQGTIIAFLLLGVALSRSSPVTITAEPRANEVYEYRLPTTVVPKTYTVDLTISDDFFTKKYFDGVVKIVLKSTVDIPVSNNITLNARNITLSTTVLPTLYAADDPNKINLLKPNSVSKNDILERMTFIVNAVIAKDKDYILELVYTGTLHEDMNGFYLSSYEENGKPEWIATTQFQPTHARRAFPCFDEPSFKAKFDISITNPKDYRAISNTHSISDIVIGDSRKTTFKTTPTMSTYLIAFIVSKFASMTVEVDSLDNTVWSQQQLIDTAQYSLLIAPKILKAMEGFTGVPYAKSELVKLDQVAIPDFSAGAMENWGLVTYRESGLLWDKAESTAQSKQRVATIVAHELAHMWFGNLITTAWWSATWLNEGFARCFQYYAADKVETDWELKYQFVIEQQQSILISDALITAEPLTSDPAAVLTPNQISSKFGSITYNKGASVIRMMEHFMGEENFYEGIKIYASEKNFGNVVPADLWSALSQAKNVSLPAGLSFETVMDSWTTKAGFPVINVTAEETRVVLTAQRFLFNNPKNVSTDSTWYIPITYTTSASKNFNNTQPTIGQWLKPNVDLKIPFQLAEGSWIILNLQSSAYCRINYDAPLWKAIQDALQKAHEDIHVLNRAQIADDALNLARAHFITYNTAFDVLDYLTKETHYYPWYSAFNAFAYLKRRINNEDDLGKFLNTHISNLMEELYKSVSFNAKTKKQVDTHKKVLTLSWACELGNEECIENAQESFNLLKENEISVDPNLRSVVYNTAIRNSPDRVNWDFLWTRFETTTMASEASLIISALGCTKDTTVLKEYLQKSITSTSGIRKQDAQSVFSAVISCNHEGVQVGLDFVIANYKAIEENYGGMNALSGVITSLADRLTTEEQVKQFETFVKAGKLGAAQESAENALERCAENLQWVESFYEDLLTYLKAKVEGPPPASTTKGPGGAATVTLSSVVFFLSIFAIFNKW